MSKPERREDTEVVTRVVKRVYWTCLDAAHRHRTELIALACIDAAAKPKRKTNTWTPLLYAQALKLRESGETLQSVGSSFGITTERARQVLAKASRMRAAGKI